MNSEIKVDKPSPSYLKHSNNGGLFVGLVYVLVLMSILALALWQNSEVDKKNKAIVTLDERIALLEEQLSLADENNTDSMTGISASLQFLDKEVRKLWDLSNKRNKVDIKKLTEQLNKLDKLFTKLQKDVVANQLNLNSMKKNIDLNLSKIDELGLSAEDLQSLRLSLSNINTQIMLLDDSVQALNNYKSQLNQVILEIQTQVSSIQNESMSNN